MSVYEEGMSEWELEQYNPAFECYKLYLAIKLHFDPKNSYDFWHYGTNDNLKFETFMKRKDRYQFLKLYRSFGNRDEKWLIAHIGANMMHDHKMWVGNLTKRPAYRRTDVYIADNEGFDYKFQTWVKDNLEDILRQNGCKFMDLFKPLDGEHPWFIKALNADALPRHILFGLARITGAFASYDKAYENDFIWPELSKKFEILSGWYVFDTEMSRRWLLRYLKENDLV